MRSLRAGKELNAVSSCGQEEGRKTVVTTISCYIFWDTEGSVVKRSHLCPWPCPNVGYCSTCSCYYYSQRPMWKNYCPITLFPPEVCSFKGSLASFLWKRVWDYQFFHSERTFSRMKTSKPPWQMSQQVLARRMYEGLKWDCLCRWERIGTSSLLSSFENKSLFRYTLAYIGIWIQKSLGREGQWGVGPLISSDEKTSQLW